MNEQDKMLALAKAVYPNRVVTDGMIFPLTFSKGLNGDMPIQFDPLHNSEQSMAVLCWLIAKTDVMFSSDDIYAIDANGVENLGTSVAHDNTPASIRAAILAAALRVVGEQ